MRDCGHDSLRLIRSALLLSLLVSPVMGAQSPPPAPDLSGQWGRDMLQFEPPASGPGPIANIARTKTGTGGGGLFIGDDANPILKPQAADVVRKRGAIALTGVAAPDPHNQCRPEPTPFTLSTQFGVEILQTRDEVVLFYLGDHKVRHVRLNAAHPARVAPGWQGDSVGHYEGDTLVIDTIGQKVGPLSMVDLFGTPFSPALHVVERYRLIDGKAASEARQKQLDRNIDRTVDPSLLAFEVLSPFYGRGPIDQDTKRNGLQVEVTVTDPAMFTAPWKALITYGPVNGDWPETVCAENTREYYANRDTPVPVADRPDF